MKSLFCLMVTATLVLAGLMVSASAQTNISKRVKFDFPFKVGEKLMPAGEYRIRMADNDPGRRLLIFEQLDGKASALVTTMAERNRAKLKPGVVLFNQYGDQRYFSGIQLGDDGLILQALKSSSERRLVKEALELAKAKSQKTMPPGNE